MKGKTPDEHYEQEPLDEEFYDEEFYDEDFYDEDSDTAPFTVIVDSPQPEEKDYTEIIITAIIAPIILLIVGTLLQRQKAARKRQTEIRNNG